MSVGESDGGNSRGGEVENGMRTGKMQRGWKCGR